MELIEELLAKEYGRFGELDTRITEFFKDVVCWCRKNGVWTWGVFEHAFEESQVDEVDQRHLGISSVINHPSIRLLEEQAEREGSDRKEESAVDEESDSADPQFEAACEASAAVCARVVERLAAVDGSDDVEMKIVTAVGLCLLLLDDESRIAYSLQGADARFSKQGGRRMSGISSDELYTKAELNEFFEDDSIGDQIWEFLGRDKHSEDAVGGSEVTRWIREVHPPRSASDEDMEDDE